MIILLVSLFIILFLGGILFVPLKIVLNTQQKEYFVILPGYLRADLLIESLQNIRFRLRIFFISFYIEPGKSRLKSKSKNNDRKQKKRIKKPLILFRNQLKNLNIQRLYASVDTGNFPLNAQLISLATQLNGEKVNININFENRNELDVCIVTRLYKLLFTTIKHKVYNK
jgi:hypothetical protein